VDLLLLLLLQAYFRNQAGVAASNLLG